MKSLNWYFRLYQFVARKRLAKEDLDPREIHSHTVAVLSTSILMWAYAFLAYFTISSPIPGVVGFITSTIHMLSPFLFRFSNNTFMICNTMLTAGMIHQATFSYFTGGFESFVLIWFGILPVIAGMIAGRKAAIYWSGLVTTWAMIYFLMHLNGYIFPNLITPTGRITALALIVFGWIFLGTCLTYTLLLMNENKENILADQSKKIENLFRVLFHDLAGPLSRLSIGLEIYKRESTLEKKQTGINVVTKALDSMREITQSASRMYTVSKGKVTSDLSLCPLNEAIDYIRHLYAAELKQKEIHLDFDYQKYQGLSLRVEPTSFKNQVLGNVISNAIKFSRPQSSIKVQAYIEDQFHVIEIIDQGIGIPQDLMLSLFDISKKTSRPGTSGESGTGFGMHIVKGFMEMYQGKIHIESNNETPNSGTVIKLFLKAEWALAEN